VSERPGLFDFGGMVWKRLERWLTHFEIIGDLVDVETMATRSGVTYAPHFGPLIGAGRQALPAGTTFPQMNAKATTANEDY
jgi:hypothetical protein